MALLQTPTPLQIMGLSSIITPHASAAPLPPSCLCFPHILLRTHEENSLYSNTKTPKGSLFSVSTQPRRLLCKPLQGKHVREDYLVKKLSAQEIQELVRGERTVPLVIDFYATWCGPCILMAQELEMLAVEYEDNLTIVKVDTDDEYEFALDMQVRGLPTLYFISPDPNKDAIRAEGLIPLQMMRDIINDQM